MILGKDGEKKVAELLGLFEAFSLRSGSKTTIEAHLELNKSCISTNP